MTSRLTTRTRDRESSLTSRAMSRSQSSTPKTRISVPRMANATWRIALLSLRARQKAFPMVRVFAPFLDRGWVTVTSEVGAPRHRGLPSPSDESEVGTPREQCQWERALERDDPATWVWCSKDARSERMRWSSSTVPARGTGTLRSELRARTRDTKGATERSG